MLLAGWLTLTLIAFLQPETTGFRREGEIPVVDSQQRVNFLGRAPAAPLQRTRRTSVARGSCRFFAWL